MTKRITDAIDSLVQALREESPEYMVTFKLFVNCQEKVIETHERYPEDLQKEGISMRNLRREFIK